MATPESKQDQQAAPAPRSDNLLPTDGTDDGRYDVAEEVNMDQQSDAARRVGQAPKGVASEALAESLGDEEAGKDGST